MRLSVRFRKWREMRKWKAVIIRGYEQLEYHEKLTRAQKREVQEFYKGLIGRRVPLYSHEYFYSRTGHFTKDYVPTNLYHCELVPRANDHTRSKVLCDKNLCDLLLPDAPMPHTWLKNMGGYFYFEGRPVSEEDAVALCGDLKDVIIKPTMKSKGTGVRKFSVSDGVTTIDGLTLSQLFRRYKRDFQIQSCVRQHPRMAALNPTSLNTLRILSYRSGMEVLIVYVVVRIGRLGGEIDNQSAGGISTAVLADGSLDKVAYSGYLAKVAYGGYKEPGVEKTDTGVVLEGYQIPSFEKVLDLVRRLHLQLPYFDLVGWDVAVDEDGEPVLIEFNTNTGLSQSAVQTGMGSLTERIFRELWPRPNTWFKY